MLVKFFFFCLYTPPPRFWGRRPESAPHTYAPSGLPRRDAPWGRERFKGERFAILGAPAPWRHVRRAAAILGCPRGRAVTCGGAEGAGPGRARGAMGQCGITSSKTVLVFLNLIFWVSPAAPREGRRLRGSRLEPGPESAAGLAQEPGVPLTPARLQFLFKLSVFNGCSEPLREVWGFNAGRSPFPRSPSPEFQGGGSWTWHGRFNEL